MRNYAIMIAILIIGLSMAYPHDTDPCAKKRSLYAQYYEAGLYEDSRNFWLQAIEVCGGELNMDFKFFKNGRSIYMQLRKKMTEDSVAYQANSDSICWIYENGLQHEYEQEWPLDYAVFLVANKYDERDKIDSLFAGYEDDATLNNHVYTHYYFQHLILNHYNKTPSEGKDEVRQTITSKYFKLFRKCLIGEQTSKEFVPTKEFLDKYFLIIQDSKTLEHALQKQFENLPEKSTYRIIEIKHAIDLMDKKGCEQGDTYSKYVEELLLLAPSAEGYLGLGKIAFARKEHDKALAAFEKALELDGDADDIYLYHMALTLYDDGQYQRAFYKAKEVEGEYKGKSMLICADCIAAKANDCGESTVKRKANYWLANDYIKKAHQLGEDVNPNKYLDNAPTEGECFTEAIYDGTIVHCECWHESTKARF